jgi:hypothetical protein
MTKINPRWTLIVPAAAAAVLALAVVLPHPAVRPFAAGVLMLAVFAAVHHAKVIAAVMLTANGIVGLCLLAGGVRHHEQGFQVRGASAALAVVP